MGTLPNFIVIGAAKSGTSSLYAYLRQHPAVFMSATKEPKFLAFEGQEVDLRQPNGWQRRIRYVTKLEEYVALFEGVTTEKAIGEASTAYLYYPSAPIGIKKHVPEARLIAILRHPADRAFSQYVHNRRRSLEPIADFAEALAREEQRIEEGWEHIFHYRNRGLYGEQLECYLAHFPREQLKIFLFEDFVASPRTILEQIFDFLGVDTTFVPDTSSRANVSGVPKTAGLQRLLTGDNPIRRAALRVAPQVGRRLVTPIKVWNMEKPRFEPDVRRRLTDSYAADIRRLEPILERDLSHWVRPAPGE